MYILIQARLGVLSVRSQTTGEGNQLATFSPRLAAFEESDISGIVQT